MIVLKREKSAPNICSPATYGTSQTCATGNFQSPSVCGESPAIPPQVAGRKRSPHGGRAGRGGGTLRVWGGAGSPHGGGGGTLRVWGGVLVLLVTWAARVSAQPTNMELPEPFITPDYPSPFIVGMPRSGKRVSSRLSLSSSLAPGFPGGPAVDITTATQEGGPKEPTPIKGEEEAEGDDGEPSESEERERYYVSGRRERVNLRQGSQIDRRNARMDDTNTPAYAAAGSGGPSAAQEWTPAPAPGPASDEDFEPNSLNATPGVIPWVKGQKVDYFTTENEPGLLLQSWPGISSADQPSVKYRPPDMALCVGEGVLLTAANLIIRAYNASNGDQLEGPIDFSSFLGVNVNYSDVACIYDAQDTRRFYLSIFGYGEGDIDKFSFFAVAVSKTSRPIDGFFGPYLIRNDGLDPANETLPGMEVCAAWNASYAAGCLGDYPVVGIDQYGLWAGFNLFQTDPPPKQIYAGPLVIGISKRDMMYGLYENPALIYVTNFNLAVGYTIAPSWTMPGTPHDLRNDGTVFLFNTGPNTQLSPPLPAVALWAITNTARLDDKDFPLSGLPLVSETLVLDTLGYIDPASVDFDFNISQPAPGIPLDPSDARTTQLTLSGGYLWCTVQTVAYVGQNLEEPYMAAIYWGLFPSFDADGNFSATTFSTGYVGVEDKHIGRPAIVATPDGQSAWMTGFISSKELYMSPFFVGIQAYDGPGTVHVPAVPQDILRPVARPDRPLNPKDPDGPGYLRVGDYSAATMDEEGNVWLATEWSGGHVDPLCTKLYSKGRCPNWSTYIMQISQKRTAIVQKTFPTS